MESVWYALLGLMLTAYVVLDGFDFGAGMAHLAVARSNAERRTVLAAIGPLWDGNEVWLIASGGVLVFAFPRAYAIAFSGFYLPLMLVLWLLVIRGLSIEFRGQWQNPLWHAFWDAGFAFASTVLAIVLGASLGNVIRGVPLGPDASFVAPLFSDFSPHGSGGALDWYTVLVGVFTALALFTHGCSFLVWKTEGDVQARSRALVLRAWPAVAIVLLVVTVATWFVQPAIFQSFGRRPWAWPALLLVVGGPFVAWRSVQNGADRTTFLGSAAFLVGLLVATAAALFPVLLRSSIAEAYSVTAYGASSGRHGLLVGLSWWIPALLLALGYFTYTFRAFAGKVRELHY